MLGFARTDLKTLRFSVDTEYENYRDENNVWKNRFLGYRFNHNMKLEFDADNERLGRVLYALAHTEVHPEFRINYTVKVERCMMSAPNATADSYSMDIEPDDIDVTDTVTVVWEIG